MGSGGLLKLLHCIRWGRCQVGHRVPHWCLVGALVEVDAPLLQGGHVERWEGLHRNYPEETKGPEHEIVGVKGLDGRTRLNMSHRELQPVDGVALADCSGGPHFC